MSIKKEKIIKIVLILSIVSCVLIAAFLWLLSDWEKINDTVALLNYDGHDGLLLSHIDYSTYLLKRNNAEMIFADKKKTLKLNGNKYEGSYVKSYYSDGELRHLYNVSTEDPNGIYQFEVNSFGTWRIIRFGKDGMYGKNILSLTTAEVLKGAAESIAEEYMGDLSTATFEEEISSTGACYKYMKSVEGGERIKVVSVEADGFYLDIYRYEKRSFEEYEIDDAFIDTLTQRVSETINMQGYTDISIEKESFVFGELKDGMVYVDFVAHGMDNDTSYKCTIEYRYFLPDND